MNHIPGFVYFGLKLPIQNLEEPFIHLVLPTDSAEEPKIISWIIVSQCEVVDES